MVTDARRTFEDRSDSDGGVGVGAEMVRRLVEVYGPGKIYIFGSVAQGETPADSDYELMVAVPDSSALILQCNQAGSPDPA